eukprot:5150559-Amphidinium_carterae.1
MEEQGAPTQKVGARYSNTVARGLIQARACVNSAAVGSLTSCPGRAHHLRAKANSTQAHSCSNLVGYPSQVTQGTGKETGRSVAQAHAACDASRHYTRDNQGTHIPKSHSTDARAQKQKQA